MKKIDEMTLKELEQIYLRLTQSDRDIIRAKYFNELLDNPDSQITFVELLKMFLKASESVPFEGFMKPNGMYFNDPTIVQRGTNFGRNLSEMSLVQLHNYSGLYAKRFGQEEIVTQFIRRIEQLAYGAY